MKIILITIILLFSINCKSQSTKPDFLMSDVYEISSLSLDSKELIFFDSILRDKKIVFLGESTHGDGTTWQAKSMIIDYLINNLQFEVLLLELNLYELEKANELLKDSSVESRYVIMESLKQLNYWSTGRETLTRVILKNKARLTFGGIDITYSNRYMSLLENDLNNLGIKKKMIESYTSILKNIDLMARSEFVDHKIIKINHKDFEHISYEIIEIINNTKKSDGKTELLKQVIMSNVGLSKWVEKISQLPFSFEDNFAFLRWTEIRDLFMAGNLSWQIERYKGKKIIVSTSTLHMSKNISQVPVMVDHLSESIKARSFFLPFISHNGSYGHKADISLYPIKSFSRDSLSLEYYLHRYGFKYGFLNLNSVVGKEMEFLNNLECYPSIILNKRSNWNEHYNGFFFIDEMKPDSLMHLSYKDIQNLDLFIKKIK